ncbi:carboxymuconolactone decarboxylase family protein [Salininema proteolyticum]|uniref:Carboxymuconolactone decarboxylase family protein n=1 Tax=Salininema proteolyticum TaxID=1607685 RepID=A0ABV8TZ58_9ACTN
MTYFPEVPAASSKDLKAVKAKIGFVPNAAARMARSPEVFRAFQRLNAVFASTDLAPLEREVLIMTVAVRNGCEVCVAMHTAEMVRLEADDATVNAVKEQRAIGKARLETMRLFAVEAMETRGEVSDEAMEAFLAQGYSTANALEVVLGIAAYTLSTFANRMTRAEIDGPLRQFT